MCHCKAGVLRGHCQTGWSVSLAIGIRNIFAKCLYWGVFSRRHLQEENIESDVKKVQPQESPVHPSALDLEQPFRIDPGGARGLRGLS